MKHWLHIFETLKYLVCFRLFPLCCAKPWRRTFPLSRCTQFYTAPDLLNVHVLTKVSAAYDLPFQQTAARIGRFERFLCSVEHTHVLVITFILRPTRKMHLSYLSSKQIRLKTQINGTHWDDTSFIISYLVWEVEEINLERVLKIEKGVAVLYLCSKLSVKLCNIMGWNGVGTKYNKCTCHIFGVVAYEIFRLERLELQTRIWSSSAKCTWHVVRAFDLCFRVVPLFGDNKVALAEQRTPRPNLFETLLFDEPKPEIHTKVVLHSSNSFLVCGTCAAFDAKKM